MRQVVEAQVVYSKDGSCANAGSCVAAEISKAVYPWTNVHASPADVPSHPHLVSGRNNKQGLTLTKRGNIAGFIVVRNGQHAEIVPQATAASRLRHI